MFKKLFVSKTAFSISNKINTTDFSLCCFFLCFVFLDSFFQKEEIKEKLFLVFSSEAPFLKPFN